VRRASWTVSALVAIGAGCSSSKPVDACATAFHKVQPLAFGGASYAGPPALMFGMVCPALTGDDYECITRATDEESLKKCSHARAAITERVAGPGPDKPSPTLAEDYARIADAVCARQRGWMQEDTAGARESHTVRVATRLPRSYLS